VRICFASSSAGAAMSVVPFSALPDGPGAPGGPAIPPSPNGGATAAAGTPGLYPGVIGALPNFGTSLANLELQMFLIDSTQIAGDINWDGGAGTAPDGGSEETCPTLIGSHGQGGSDTPVVGRLTSGVDYWPLPAILAGTFLDGKTYLVSFTGCVGGYQVSTEAANAGITGQTTCGQGYDGGGPTLGVVVNQLDTTTSASNATMGVQFVDDSTALQGNPYPYSASPLLVHPPASDGVLPGFPGAGDVASFTPVSTPLLAPPAPGPLSAPVDVGGVLLADGGLSGRFGVLTVPGSEPDGGEVLAPYPASVQSGGVVQGDLLALSLGDVFELSGWTVSTAAAPASFTYGQNFTFVLVGNNDFTVPQLAAPDGGINEAYDGRGLHIVAFPNTFTPKTF
jgi:hypothetical protein